MSKKDLEKVGSRFMTSKCHSLKDLEGGGLCKYGYRGEALSNIRHTAAILQIVSRKNTENETWTVLFARGKRKPVKEFYQKRHFSGTTVTVVDFLYNLPVRKGIINPTLDLQEIVQASIAISLANPQTAFTLRNEVTGTQLLQTYQCCSSNVVFHTVFGQKWKDLLLEIRKESGTYSMQGFVGREGAANTDKQFLYVNNRSIKRSKLFKIVNNHLKKTIICKQIPVKFVKEVIAHHNLDYSPSKLMKVYPIFCIELKLPFLEFDITFEPKKTEIEFENWDSVTTFIGSALEGFIEINNLLPPEKIKLDRPPEEWKKEQKLGNHVRDILNNFPITGIKPLETTVLDDEFTNS